MVDEANVDKLMDLILERWRDALITRWIGLDCACVWIVLSLEFRNWSLIVDFQGFGGTVKSLGPRTGRENDWTRRQLLQPTSWLGLPAWRSESNPPTSKAFLLYIYMRPYLYITIAVIIVKQLIGDICFLNRLDSCFHSRAKELIPNSGEALSCFVRWVDTDHTFLTRTIQIAPHFLTYECHFANIYVLKWVSSWFKRKMHRCYRIQLFMIY